MDVVGNPTRKIESKSDDKLPISDLSLLRVPDRTVNISRNVQSSKLISVIRESKVHHHSSNLEKYGGDWYPIVSFIRGTENKEEPEQGSAGIYLPFFEKSIQLFVCIDKLCMKPDLESLYLLNITPGPLEQI